MSYTVTAISTAFSASLYEGVAVTNAILCEWLDEAQTEIAKRYGKVETTAYAASVKGTAYALPATFLSLAEVTYEGRRSDRFTITDYGKIIFDEDGDFSLYYHRQPAIISKIDGNAVPEVDAIFHPAIVTYLLFKYWTKESESTQSESKQGQEYLALFYEQIKTAASTLHARHQKTGPTRLPTTVDGWFDYAEDYKSLVSIDDVCAWMDEAQIEIAKRYGVVATQAYASAVADTRYALPVNALDTIKVYDDDNKPYLDYRISMEGEISFNDDGDYVYEYYQVPATISRLAPALEVHTMFYPAVATYCLYKYWSNLAEGEYQKERKANNYLKQFNDLVYDTASRLKQRARGARRITLV